MDDTLREALTQTIRDEIRVQLTPVIQRIERLEGRQDRREGYAKRRDDTEIVSIKRRLKEIERKMRRELEDTQEFPIPEE